MTPLDQAAAAVDAAQERFDRVWTSTLSPGLLQLAGRELIAAVEHYVDVRRETVRAS